MDPTPFFQLEILDMYQRIYMHKILFQGLWWQLRHKNHWSKELGIIIVDKFLHRFLFSVIASWFSASLRLKVTDVPSWSLHS